MPWWKRCLLEWCPGSFPSRPASSSSAAAPGDACDSHNCWCSARSSAKRRSPGADAPGSSSQRPSSAPASPLTGYVTRCATRPAPAAQRAGRRAGRRASARARARAATGAARARAPCTLIRANAPATHALVARRQGPRGPRAHGRTLLAAEATSVWQGKRTSRSRSAAWTLALALRQNSRERARPELHHRAARA